MMIKLSIKNYFRCLLLIFIPIICYGIGILISTAIECGIHSLDFITGFNNVFNMFLESSEKPINVSNIIFIVLGIFVLLGYFLTRMVIRKKIAKRDLKTGILIYIFDLVIVALSLWLISYISTLWSVGGLLTSLVTLFVYGVIALLEAYLAHHNEGDKVNEIVNIKNVFLLYFSNIILYCITSALCFLLKAFVNNFVYAFIQIPLYLISLTVIELNAEAYTINKLNIKQ